MRRARPWRVLAALPSLGILVGVPLVHRVHAYVLGLPFMLFWIVACVLLTSVLMAVVAALDRARDREEDRASRGDPDGGTA